MLALTGAPLAAQGDLYSGQELDDMLAPIALYPDPLLSQVLAAAAFPDQIAAAPPPSCRLSGSAIASQNWDPSVKAVAGYPEVLQMLAGNPGLDRGPWLGSPEAAGGRARLRAAPPPAGPGGRQPRLHPSAEGHRRRPSRADRPCPAQRDLRSHYDPPSSTWTGAHVWGGGRRQPDQLRVGYAFGSWSYNTFDWHHHHWNYPPRSAPPARTSPALSGGYPGSGQVGTRPGTRPPGTRPGAPGTRPRHTSADNGHAPAWDAATDRTLEHRASDDSRYPPAPSRGHPLRPGDGRRHRSPGPGHVRRQPRPPDAPGDPSRTAPGPPATRPAAPSVRPISAASARPQPSVGSAFGGYREARPGPAVQRPGKQQPWRHARAVAPGPAPSVRSAGEAVVAAGEEKEAMYDVEDGKEARYGPRRPSPTRRGAILALCLGGLALMVAARCAAAAAPAARQAAQETFASPQAPVAASK